MSSDPLSRLSRRRVLLGLAGATALPVLAACAAATPTPVPPKPSEAPIPSEPPKPAAAPATPTAAPKPTEPRPDQGAPGTRPAPAAASPTPAAAKPAAKEPTEIRFATDWVEGPRGETIKVAVPEFEKTHPQIKVKVEPVGGDYWDTVNVQFAGGTVADVILADGYFFQAYKDQGAYVALDDVLKAKGIDLNAYTIMPDISTDQGKLYGMPFQQVVSGWAYNVTMFREAGLKPPDETWTWDNILTAAKALTKPDGQQYGSWIYNNDEFYWGPLLFADGARYRNPENTKCMLDAEGGVEAFQWVIDLIYKHKVSPTPAQRTQLQGQFGSPWVAGKVGVMPAPLQGVGGWLRQIGNRFEWDLMPTPKSPKTGKAMHTWNDQPHYVTNGALKRKVVEQAAEFAVFMSGDFVQGRIAVDRGSIPVVKKILTGEAFMKPPPNSMQIVAKNMMAPDNQLPPYVHKLGLEFKTVVDKELDKAFVGEKPAADALRDAVREADKVLAQMKR